LVIRERRDAVCPENLLSLRPKIRHRTAFDDDPNDPSISELTVSPVRERISKACLKTVKDLLTSP